MEECEKMKPEIKQRIEQIKVGQVPVGYKRTKVGIIPEEWGVKKLSSISSRAIKKNTDGEIQTTYTNSATQGVIKQTDYFDKEISNRDNISGYYVVEENDYIYNPRISTSAPCGPINKSHFVEKGVVSPLYTVFRMNQELQNNKYIEFYFKSSIWHRYMYGVANYGARHDRMNITNNDLFGMPIAFPPIAEQEKIAKILSAQDKVIELQQKKIDELQKLKKGLLQKMFPKKGQKVPELRFPNFVGDWEPREFGNMFIERREKTKSENEDTLLSCAINGMFLNTELFGHFRGSTTIGYLKVKKNDLILSAQNLHLGNANVNLRFESGIISPAYKVFDIIDCDSGFVQAWVKKDSTKDLFLSCTTEGASVCRKNIDWSELEKRKIAVPELKEQQQIGLFFSNLDNLIALHQRKLVEMKEHKKSLMQLLLTGIVRV